ncbi:MAG: hypothetical protein Q9200_000796 [Gallowayella weberi]
MLDYQLLRALAVKERLAEIAVKVRAEMWTVEGLKMTRRRSLHDEHNEQEDTAIRNHQAQIDVENWVTADGESKFSNQNLGSNQRQASHLARQPSPNNQGPRNAAAPA